MGGRPKQQENKNMSKTKDPLCTVFVHLFCAPLCAQGANYSMKYRNKEQSAVAAKPATADRDKQLPTITRFDPAGKVGEEGGMNYPARC